MPTFTLTDVAHDLWLESFALHAHHLAPGSAVDWSVRKRTLHGGRREGVDLIEVDNGAFTFSIVPTRGMGLWKGRYKGLPVGWQSPVTDGPVNPAFVNLLHGGGLGWLEGFDELLARCGLENNGAPYVEGTTTYGLHGKIANLPAHYVAIHADEGPNGEIRVEGHVDESRLFFTQVRMVTTISTVPGSNKLTVRDEFRNTSDLPQDMQILYHWNFGKPFLEEGSRMLAPAKLVMPRNARAVEGIGHFDTYAAPAPGFAEQVYFYDLHAADSGRTLALLQNPSGAKGLVLRFEKKQLPCFTLWKNTGGLKSGYVTGLEPGTNYPNPKPFEKEHQRVVTLPPGGSYVTETSLEILVTKKEVDEVTSEIAVLQKKGAPEILKAPAEPFAAP